MIQGCRTGQHYWACRVIAGVHCNRERQGDNFASLERGRVGVSQGLRGGTFKALFFSFLQQKRNCFSSQVHLFFIEPRRTACYAAAY